MKAFHLVFELESIKNILVAKDIFVSFFCAQVFQKFVDKEHEHREATDQKIKSKKMDKEKTNGTNNDVLNNGEDLEETSQDDNDNALETSRDSLNNEEDEDDNYSINNEEAEDYADDNQGDDSFEQSILVFKRKISSLRDVGSDEELPDLNTSGSTVDEDDIMKRIVKSSQDDEEKVSEEKLHERDDEMLHERERLDEACVGTNSIEQSESVSKNTSSEILKSVGDEEVHRETPIGIVQEKLDVSLTNFNPEIDDFNQNSHKDLYNNNLSKSTENLIQNPSSNDQNISFIVDENYSNVEEENYSNVEEENYPNVEEGNYSNESSQGPTNGHVSSDGLEILQSEPAPTNPNGLTSIVRCYKTVPKKEYSPVKVPSFEVSSATTQYEEEPQYEEEEDYEEEG